jgi:CubicO group peptidase (beta-lactamase class C family)
MVESLRFLEPSRDFRASFQYNNLMYMTVGYVAGHAAGSTWEDLVRGRILTPLAMADTNFSVTLSEKSADWARNYREMNGALVEAPPAVIDALGPAGSINSTLEDMTRYLRMHLERGELDGRRIVQEKTVAETQTPQITVPAGAMPGVWDHLGATGYGLGLEVAQYRGHKMVFHTGTIGGYHALLTFLPERKTGMAMMMNRVERAVPPAIAFQVYDRLLGGEPRDWLEHYTAWSRRSRKAESAERKAVAAKRRSGTKPGHPLEDYAGEYGHPAYGVMKIEARNGGLAWSRGSRQGALSHFHYDVFEMTLPSSSLRVRFLTNVDGEVDQLAAKLEPAVPEIVFTRSKRSQ